MLAINSYNDYLWSSIELASISVVSSITGYSSGLLHHWLITPILPATALTR